MDDFEEYQQKLNEWSKKTEEWRKRFDQQSIRLTAYCKQLRIDSERAVERSNRILAEINARKNRINDDLNR